MRTKMLPRSRCKYDRVIDPSDRYALHPRRCTRAATKAGYCAQHARKVERLAAIHARWDK